MSTAIDWPSLPEDLKRMYVGLMKSFAIEKDGELIFPDEDAATAWAIEAYTVGQLISRKAQVSV